MPKRKVLILCNQLTGGGVEKVMQDVANHLASKTDLYDVTVTVLESPDEGRELFVDNVKIKGVFRSQAAYKKWSIAWILFKMVQRLYMAYLRLRRQDILLVLKDQWYTAFGTKIKANRKIAWLHSDFEMATYVNREECRDTLAVYDKVICVSNYVKHGVIKTVGDTGNLTVAYNPVDVKKIIGLGEQCVELPQKSNNGPVFVSVCRLSRDKDMRKLLECAKMLMDNYDFSLWIVGDGEERKNIEKYIEENNLSNVVMLGWLSNPYPIIMAADWLISASICETYGLAIQEANVIGKPAIAGTLPVFEECVNNENVILVENSVNGLLKAMTEAIEGKLSINVDVDIEKKHKEFYDDRIELIENIIVG